MVELILGGLKWVQCVCVSDLFAGTPEGKSGPVGGGGKGGGGGGRAKKGFSIPNRKLSIYLLDQLCH